MICGTARVGSSFGNKRNAVSPIKTEEHLRETRREQQRDDGGAPCNLAPKFRAPWPRKAKLHETDASDKGIAYRRDDANRDEGPPGRDDNGRRA